MKVILEKICRDQNLEAQWLNTLSLLEHIGARKIAKTVAQVHPSLQILEHLADETRHAYVFKRLSVGIGEGTTESYLCREAAIHYFQELDHGVAHWLHENLECRDSYSNYLLTTSLIERRAMQVYPSYRDLTSQPRVRDELNRVIQEEAGHRQGIDRDIRDRLGLKGYTLNDCWSLEDELFHDFLTVLESHLSALGSQRRQSLPGSAPRICVE